ncbi:MAG: histone deacetylase family protein [Candidatus Limnocylindria bacterium]
MSVLLVTDAAMERHPAPGGHPERPARLAAAASGVSDAVARAGESLHVDRADPAGDDELTRVHDRAYVALLRTLDARGGGWLDPDTFLGSGSLDAARVAAGATIAAAAAVAADRHVIGFAIVRPPGHHAARSRAAGFCLFNNVAIAAESLRADGAARRIAIVDWDVHHGDGTQEIYEADPDVWYGSTHQTGIYPGTGTAEQAGVGAAHGTKLNRPLRPGSGDEAFVGTWSQDLLPALAAFAPDAVVVSAGYDAHTSDPLATLRVSSDGFRRVAERLGEVVGDLGLRGVTLTLEGGYDLDALRSSTAATVEGLLSALGSR